MEIVTGLFWWTDHLLAWAEFALWIWAVADCASRKAAAFPAASKMTKPAWLTILVLATLFGYLVMQPFGYASPVHIVALITTVAASVYLADVRPAIKGITGRR